MKLLVGIALKHLLARKRQSLVSLLGIVLGTAFFLAISSLMRGSEADFVRRLIDNSPHITVYDDFRVPSRQPLEQLYTDGAIEIRGVKLRRETRGIRGYRQILDWLRSRADVRASPVLMGQGLINYAGRDVGVTINGMIPEDVKDVTTIASYMREGRVEDLAVNPDGIIIGGELARKLALRLNTTVTIASSSGSTRVFKIVGIFRTGRAGYDEQNIFMTLKRAQALLQRGHRINTLIVKLPDPQQARMLAAGVEARSSYKSVSWQEASEDLMNTLAIRNTIMFTVVSAVLVVAAFGIYNVISTVVMEKHRDIAILKSMGFLSRDVRTVFLVQGVILGLVGSGMGLPLGSIFMFSLEQIQFRPPGATELVRMPIDWGVDQFCIAAGFALVSAVAAAVLPARKAAHVQPVDILRGGA